MSFCNSNEKDNSNTCTVAPHAYNRSPNQKAYFDIGKFPTRPISLGSSPAMVREQMESNQFPNDYRGPYKVLQKQPDGWGENDFDDNPIASMHHSGKGSSQRKPMRENGWEVDHRKHGSEAIPKSVIVDECWLKKPEPMASPTEGLQILSVIKKDVALIDKVEGLNTKARNFDESVSSALFKEKSKDTADGGYEPTAVGRVMPKVVEIQASSDSFVGERTQFQMRGHGRANYKGRGNFSSQENEEGKRKSVGTPTSVMSSKRNVDVQLGMYIQDHCKFQEVFTEKESNSPDNAGTEPHVPSSVDANNYKAQHAQVKELASQLARQIWDPGGWVDASTTADTPSLEVVGSPTKATHYIQAAGRVIMVAAFADCGSNNCLSAAIFCNYQ